MEILSNKWPQKYRGYWNQIKRTKHCECCKENIERFNIVKHEEIYCGALKAINFLLSLNYFSSRMMFHISHIWKSFFPYSVPFLCQSLISSDCTALRVVKWHLKSNDFPQIFVFSVECASLCHFTFPIDYNKFCRFHA